MSFHQRGVSRSSRTRGGMRWTLTVLLTRAPDADGEVVWSWRLDAGVKSIEATLSATETNQPDLRGEHEVSRKTIAWGMPGVTGVTCMLVCAFYSILHTRPWGASSARHSLRPFRGRGDRNQANLAQRHAARMRRCVLPSLRAQRSNPPFRLLRHGLLRFARNDDSNCRHPRKPVIQYSRGSSDGFDRPQRTGYSAEYDESCVA